MPGKRAPSYEAALRWEQALLRIDASTDSLNRSKAALERARRSIDAGRAKWDQKHFDSRLDRTHSAEIGQDGQD